MRKDGCLALIAMGVAACSDVPTASPAAAQEQWCASAPLPQGWRRAQGSDHHLEMEAPIDRYGGVSEGNMPPVHNKVTVGISRAALTDLIIRPHDVRNNELYHPSDSLNVAGFKTYEAAGVIVLVSNDETSSARCLLPSDPRMAPVCDFFISIDGAASARIFAPVRIVESSLPAILADVRSTAEFTIDQCADR